MHGVNFASQDYLSLSSHSGIKATAKETIERCGVHSAGSPAFGRQYVLLRRAGSGRSPDFLKNGGSGAISDGLGGGFRRDQGLGPIGRPCGHGHVVALCLQEGANAATHKIHLFRHLDNEYCRNILSKIRANG